MPEGPSLILFREDLLFLEGRRVKGVAGNAKIDQAKLQGKVIRELRTWGKHLLIRFDDFAIRIHFLMFGTYYINSEKPDAESRLRLRIETGKGYVNFYTCAVKMVEDPLDEVYDWTNDVLSEAWDPKKARKKLKDMPDTLVTDALLDQTVFSGVGNIIKNEVLYRIGVHPLSTIGALPPRKLGELIKEARQYSFDFLQWKREFTLRQHWLVHTKRTCGRDGGPIQKEYLGTTNRRTFFCPVCQKRYG